MVRIEMVPAAATSDNLLVGDLTELINRVYEVAEAGIWVDGYARTTLAELSSLIAAGEIAVARAPDGEIAGAVRIQELGDGLGELGMLVAVPVWRGRGVGRDLVRFAEQYCAGTGSSTMQLELLVPRDWLHPTKVFLDRWYTRISYRVVRRAAFEGSYPHLAPLLATPCDFMIYQKPMVAIP